tara:strand:+ start:248 stop:676 length:429 start_codon:yes stop_codon:yes gene_type:complete
MRDKKEYFKNYYKTPKGKKNYKISDWKKNGLKESREFMEQIYKEYLKSEECELCGEPYKNSRDKQMEHNHLTGEFRNICCNRCNHWKADRAGKNINKCKKGNKYEVRIKRNYKDVLRTLCNTEEECREILDKFIMDNPHYFT